MFKKTALLTAVVAGLAVVVGSAQAGSIYSEDFEATGVADGAFTPSDWSGTIWTTSVSANLLNPNGTGNAWLNPVPPALGEIFAVIHSGTTQQADLGLTFADNTIYTLTFTHFRRDDLAGDDVTAQIMTTGGTVLATDTFSAVGPTDTYEIRTVSFTTNGGPEVSQNIRLQLIDATGGGVIPQAGIDNIDLDATLIPEPASLALLGLGGLVIVRRRK